MGECQAVVAEAIATFGKVDILLCCTSQGIAPIFCLVILHIELANGSCSPYRYCRGACGFSADIKPRPGPVRDQLLRASQHRESNIASSEKAKIRTHHDSLGDK